MKDGDFSHTKTTNEILTAVRLVNIIAAKMLSLLGPIVVLTSVSFALLVKILVLNLFQ